MSAEIKELLKFNIDTLVIKKFKVFDLNGSTAFTVSTSTWSLKKRADESEILTGSSTVNNSDVDRAGNTIKTVSLSIDLRDTDEFARGAYYLIIQTSLSTGHMDIFRVPTELVDYRRMGAA